MRSPGSPRRLAPVLAALAALGASSCGRAPHPEVVDLALGFRPARLIRTGQEAHAFTTLEGRQARIVEEGGEAWLEVDLGPEGWTFNERTKVHETPLSVRGFGTPPDGGAPQRLVADGLEREWFDPRRILPGFVPGPRSFLATENRLRVQPLDDGAAPSSATLRLYLGRGAETDGRWIVSGSRFSGEALAVWPGERVEVATVVPPESRLNVTLVNEPFPGLAVDGPASVRFRVRLDDEVLLTAELPADESGFARHALALPEEGRRSARLVFEVEGPPAFTAFFEPRLVPAREERPASRPDVILFQADTLRADSLEAYGSELGLTPNLDRLARRSLLYRRAWSTSTYTLPAHATLFTGVYPREAGILGAEHALGSGLDTLAELFAEAGYRTGAVTDAVFVSRRYGLARGFGFFDEHQDGLPSTLARVRSFLDDPDPRPLFLFVQSYRVHAPYVVSEETRAAHGERLGIEGTFEELSRRRLALVRNAETEGRPLSADERAEIDGIVTAMQAHYRGGVIDFDRGFQELVEDLDRRSFLARGWLLFTSDHGEAFHEHDELFHAGTVWEEELRVPLFLLGPGVEPRVVDHPASLIDVSPTLAELAGLRRPHVWRGKSLVALGHDRPLYAFQCFGPPEESTFALIDLGRKLIGYEAPEAIERRLLRGAYDLTRDPAELEDVQTTERWPVELLERYATDLRRHLTPLVRAREADLDEGQLKALEDMGYAGEGRDR